MKRAYLTVVVVGIDTEASERIAQRLGDELLGRAEVVDVSIAVPLDDDDYERPSLPPLAPTPHRRTVAQAILDLHNQGKPIYAWAITQLTGLPGGTLHPILGHFVSRGWINLIRPASTTTMGAKRKPYTVTPEGLQELAALAVAEQ